VEDAERGEDDIGKKVVIERKEFHSSYYQELANSKAIRSVNDRTRRVS
jgi:hypothetical protein